MSKKKLFITMGVAIFVAVCVIGVFLLQDKATLEQTEEAAGYFLETPEPESIDIPQDVQMRLVKRNKKDVIWTVSDDVFVNEEYLDLLNKELKKDGYSFQLKFQYLNEMHYDEEVREVLKKGNTDIVLGGQNTSKKINVVSDLCREGLLLDLQPYLEAESGKALFEEYEKALWGSVTVDGTIYTVPNGIYEDGRYCVVFNKEFIEEEKAEQFNGDVFTLESYLEGNVKEKLLCTWSYDDMASVLGYYEKEGLFFEAESGKVCYPFSEDRVYEFYKMLNNLWRKDKVDGMCSFISRDSMDDINDKIRSGEFCILLTKWNDLLKEIQDSVVLKEIEFVPNFARNGGTNGICKTSKKAEEAVQLLTLLHTEEKYARLLLYGVEGKDYELENGRINSADNDLITIDILGLYRSSYPSTDDTIYSEDIRQQKQAIYRSENCKESVMSGFQINQENLTEEELLSIETALYYYDVWKEENFEEAYKKVCKIVEKEEKALAEKIKEQLTAWKEKVK